STSAANPTYTIGDGTNAVTITGKASTYTLTLTNTNATTSGSTAARVTYNSSTVYGGTSGTSAITNPSRSYTISGFDTSYNNASGATVSSTASKTYSYSFDGWYTEASNGTRLITSAKALVPSVTVGGTNYTNASSQWVATSGTTLYAHWANGTAITLPTITKTGYTCGWTTSTSTSAITYASGYSGLVPTANMTLHGVCKINTYTITLARSNAETIVIDGTSYTGTSATLTYGTHTISGTYPSGYEFSSWATSNSTNLAITSTSTASTSITVHGAATLTLNGKLSVIPMQTYTKAQCQSGAASGNVTVTDSRDNNTYTVRYINGNCWMTQNLRFTGTSIDSTTTNINTTKTLSYGDLTSGNSSTEPRIHDSGNATTGVWYNYCAASAGTICTDSDSTEASYSLCPAGWRLPTYTEQQAITSYTTAFSPTTGGRYYKGSLEGTGSGFWWSSTAYNVNRRYFLYSAGSSLNTSSDYRYYGTYVRCVLDTRTPYEKLQAGVLSMQDIGNLSSAESTTLLSQMTENTQYNVPDSRDGQDYTVAKLPYGKVWMTKNLNLAGGTALTPADSNVSAGCNLGNNCTLPASSTSGFSDNSTAYVYNSGSTTCGDGSPCYSYYSYVAATAGTSPSSGNATSDICPKGWRLPTEAEFNTLIRSYTTGAALTASPFLGVYAGYYSNSSFNNGGNYGLYWSSTAGSSIYAYSLRFSSSSTSTSTSVVNDNKRGGGSIRCVLNVPTMQDFTANDAAAMATGETKTLADSRDGQDYTVAKLPDGNVWMTKNLNLAGGTTLTPATSNVSSNYTLPASSTSGFSDSSTAYVYNSGSTTCGDDSPCYSYYSYIAATAGTNPSSGNATSDICPKGWRLPTRAEFNTLKSSYSTGSKLTGSPFLAVYGGDYYNSSFDGGGSYGNYWSSTAYSSSFAYNLYFDSSDAYVDYNDKRNGFSVRCVKS
ncbi:hypothetical protein IKG24_01190, partial [Candidatus Saccharibacteria bacterium]|nr:hypothetical protein [Candidatus Saccharibacteria bacterium]